MSSMRNYQYVFKIEKKKCIILFKIIDIRQYFDTMLEHKIYVVRIMLLISPLGKIRMVMFVFSNCSRGNQTIFDMDRLKTLRSENAVCLFHHPVRTHNILTCVLYVLVRYVFRLG